jgi:hypothetical protein
LRRMYGAYVSGMKTVQAIQVTPVKAAMSP